MVAFTLQNKPVKLSNYYSSALDKLCCFIVALQQMFLGPVPVHTVPGSEPVFCMTVCWQLLRCNISTDLERFGHKTFTFFLNCRFFLWSSEWGTRQIVQRICIFLQQQIYIGPTCLSRYSFPTCGHVSVPIPPVHRSRISTLSSGFTFISSPRFLFPTVVFSAVRVEICWLKKEKKRRRRRDG